MAESSEPAVGFNPPGTRDLRYSPFLPLLLLVVAAVAWSAFQCYQLVLEKQGLAAVNSNQTTPYENAGKLRNSLDSLARETAILADKGNPGAKLIVGELAKRGVTINPNAPAATPDKAAK
jgi:hypothetical protein